MTAVKRVLAMLQPLRGRLVWAGVLMLATTAATLLGPELIGVAIDDGIRDGSMSTLRWAVLGVAIAALVENGAGAWQRYTLIQVGVRVITDLRGRLHAHLLKLSQAFHDRNRPGDLMARVDADTETLSDFVTWSVISTLQSLLTLGGIIWILLRTDAVLTVAAFAVTPLMAAATWRWARNTRKRYADVRAAVGEVSARAEESLSGIHVIKGLRRERDVRARFDDANVDQRDKDLGTDRVSAGFYPVIDVLGDVAVAVVLGLGGIRVLSGDLQPGDLVTVVLLVQRFFDPIRELTTRLDSLQDAVAAGDRIFTVLDTPATVVDRPGAQNYSNTAPAPAPGIDIDSESRPSVGGVQLHNVDFAYEPGRPVLHDINLDIPAGSTLALVGETGAGKTTIARLIGRVADPDAGRVRLDGVDLRDLTVASLRSRIAWVPQTMGLFAGTVLENLRYGRPSATIQEVQTAAEAVGAHDIIEALADGYDTHLDEGGTGLSAGERQLIAFARAVLIDPVIIVLDEATANVDLVTEARMQDGLGRLLDDRTSVIIAHRLSTILRADTIAVVDHGRIVEQGTHDQLLALDGLYAALLQTQLSGDGLIDA